MPDIKLAYVPHGINTKYFYPIDENSESFKEFSEFEKTFKDRYKVDFIIFWNNRNIARKHPGDVILAYKTFVDKLPPEERSKVCLLMKTAIIDPNGTDLNEVRKNICPDYKVIFNEELLPPLAMNYMYNMADVTLNIASNEGFGLSNAESIMAGTVTVTNVTGGLQDQCGFVTDSGDPVDFDIEFTSNHTGVHLQHGPWTKPVFPTNRSLQGSIYTPYIFDDRCSFEDVANALYDWYLTPKEERKYCGKIGSNWMQEKQTGMSAKEMGVRMIHCIDDLLQNWQPPISFKLEKFQPKKYNNPIGIV